jgi:phage N-6-adenine-methyltransferase
MDTQIVVLPEPSSDTPALVNACRAVYSARTSLIGHMALPEANEARRRSSAIEEYLRGTEAYPDAQRAARVLEMAVGAALGLAKEGRPPKGNLPSGASLDEHERLEFRQLFNGREKIEPYLETDGLSREAALRIAKGGHVSANAGENEWYTPAAYIAAAVRVMGAIDLDPCSTAIANEVVGAAQFYTAEDDGLSHGWHGRVWMNPPYAQPLVYQFCDKICEEVAGGNVSEAIVLVNNNTDTVMFQRMAEIAKAICFPSGRVKFWHPDRTAAPLQGQAVLYFGENVKAFCTEFREFGFCVAVIG